MASRAYFHDGIPLVAENPRARLLSGPLRLQVCRRAVPEVTAENSGNRVGVRVGGHLRPPVPGNSPAVEFRSAPETGKRDISVHSAGTPAGTPVRKKAGCAVARSILIIVWRLLNDPAARYRDLGPDWHARHTDRSRKARNAQRQLETLGYDVIITLREDAA
jgi:hypothetical protein